MNQDHVRTLDEGTADYYGTDVSSVSNIPDNFNEISREDPYKETDTSSATDGLIDGFNDRAVDDHIGPDPDAVMQSVGDGGGGDLPPTGPLTDVHGVESAYDGTDEGSSLDSGDTGGQEARIIDDGRENSGDITGAMAQLEGSGVYEPGEGGEGAPDPWNTSGEANSRGSAHGDAAESSERRAEANQGEPQDRLNELSMENTKPELEKAAQERELDDSGTKQQILDRINEYDASKS